MNQRSTLLRAAPSTALLVTTATAGACSGACDPMYPCYTDAVTPPAVYDLTARAPTAHADHASDAASTPALTTKGLGGEQFEDHPHDRNGGNAHAAAYDLAVRTDDAPCESYPCYPETAKAAIPIPAEAGVTQRAVYPRS